MRDPLLPTLFDVPAWIAVLYRDEPWRIRALLTVTLPAWLPCMLVAATVWTIGYWWDGY